MRRNAPRLIDPMHAIQSATDNQLGIVSAAELLARIETLEREIARMKDDAARRLPIDLPYEKADAQMIGADVWLTRYASLIAVEESPNPGLTIGSAAGTGGSAGVTFSRGGSDAAGQIRVTCGTSGLGTGTLVTFAFNVAKPNSNYIVLFAESSTAARAVNLSISTLSTSGFPILANTAPTSGNQIDINYLIVEVPAQ